MKIIFKKLKIENFMSFENAELTLDDSGYFLIKGINNNEEDSASSNGSGKSTIFEALCWGLTGETIRGTKNVSNIFTDKGALVEIHFNVDKNDYVLIRKKDPSNLSLFINGEDKSGKGIRDTEKILSQYLPDLSSSLIGSVVILGQGLPQRFTNNSPSGRKEILEKLSRSDFMIADLKEKVSKRKSHLNAQLRKIEDVILTLKTKKTYTEENLKGLQDKINNLESEEELQAKLKSEEHGLEGHLKAKDMFEAIIKENSADISALNLLVKEYEDKIKDTQTEIIDKYSSEIKGIEASYNQYAGESTAIKAEIDRIQNIKDVCPMCGQKLHGIEKPSTKELEVRLKEILDVKYSLQESLDKQKFNMEKELGESCSEFKAKKLELEDTIKEKEKTISTNAELLRNNDDYIVIFKNKIAKVEQILNSRSELYNSYENECEVCKTEIEKLNDEILYNND